ncbi:unnamed protein product, partial [Ectocarpus sp. 12 AP-2014]
MPDPPNNPPVVRPPLHPGQNFLFVHVIQHQSLQPWFIAVISRWHASHVRIVLPSRQQQLQHPSPQHRFRQPHIQNRINYHRPSLPPLPVWSLAAGRSCPHLVSPAAPAAAAVHAAIALSTLSGPSAAATIGQQPTVADHRISTAWIRQMP